MIKTYSQRLLTPYFGLVQIAESERARALTVDGQTWEIQFLRSGNGSPSYSNNFGQGIHHRYRRAVTINNNEIQQMDISSASSNDQAVDERIVELTEFLKDVSLPFSAVDHFEYWLLDEKDRSPLALIFSCRDAEQMGAYPSRPEWTALPAAVMPIENTEEEQSYSAAPVNYRLERLVAERAGNNPKAKWFTRGEEEEQTFPDFMIREDWQEEENSNLCQRYLKRQSPRLLMLHNLNSDLRRQLEINARSHAVEVARFYELYPEIVDKSLMNSLLVEARLRNATEDLQELHKRRDGIHYL